MFGIRRGKFIAVLCGAATWPLGVRAQPPAMPVIGFLRTTPSATFAHLMPRGLNEVGFIEGSERRDRAALDRRSG
jgi:putative ABC transport system substrate-binding protein